MKNKKSLKRKTTANPDIIVKALVEATRVISAQNNGCCLVSLSDALRYVGFTDPQIKKFQKGK